MPTPELELQLSLLARRLSKPVRLPGESGFTVLDRPAYQALWRIVEEGPMRSTALAKLIGIDLSVVSRQVKFLEEVGFVQRQPDPLDARAALVSATESGHSALELSRSKRTEVLDEVLEHWAPEDRAELVRLLGRFNSELEVAIERRMAADPG
ncbi:MAG: transcriptional regulator [Frankiales bacterium]|nr:transcriptional regulator [Frankiales bacterium]